MEALEQAFFVQEGITRELSLGYINTSKPPTAQGRESKESLCGLTEVDSSQ